MSTNGITLRPNGSWVCQCGDEGNERDLAPALHNKLVHLLHGIPWVSFNEQEQSEWVCLCGAFGDTGKEGALRHLGELHPDVVREYIAAAERGEEPPDVSPGDVRRVPEEEQPVPLRAVASVPFSEPPMPVSGAVISPRTANLALETLALFAAQHASEGGIQAALALGEVRMHLRGAME